jgi:hypothetical protein
VKYIAKDLEDVAIMLERFSANERRLAEAFTKTSKGAAANHTARAVAFDDAAALLRDVELRP